MSDAIAAYNRLARQRTEQGGPLRERLNAALGNLGGRGSSSHPPARTISNWADFVRDTQDAPAADDEGTAMALATSRYAPSRLRSVAIPELTGEQQLMGVPRVTKSYACFIAGLMVPALAHRPSCPPHAS